MAHPRFRLADIPAVAEAARQSPPLVAQRRIEARGGAAPADLAVQTGPPRDVTRPADRDASARGRNRTGLPDRLKAGVEALSGIAMDDVRVRYRSPEPARIGALAFARGRDIHLATGQDRHLAHEAWHVVQQARGRVNRTTQGQ